MRDFFKAPGILPGILMIAAAIALSVLLRHVGDDTLFMAGSFGCIILCYLGAKPMMEYISAKEKQKQEDDR